MSHYTSDEIRAFFAQLSHADWLRLEHFARYQVYRFRRLSAGELLNEVVVRVLRGQRRCPRDVPLMATLRGVIRSVADELRDKEKAFAQDESLAATSEEATALPGESPELLARDRELIAIIWALFDDDAEAQALLLGVEAGLSAIEVQAKFDMTPSIYDAARKRLERKVRFFLKGLGK